MLDAAAALRRADRRLPRWSADHDAVHQSGPAAAWTATRPISSPATLPMPPGRVHQDSGTPPPGRCGRQAAAHGRGQVRTASSTWAWTGAGIVSMPIRTWFAQRCTFWVPASRRHRGSLACCLGPGAGRTCGRFPEVRSGRRARRIG